MHRLIDGYRYRGTMKIDKDNTDTDKSKHQAENSK